MQIWCANRYNKFQWPRKPIEIHFYTPKENCVAKQPNIQHAVLLSLLLFICFFVIVHKLLSYVSIVYPKLKPVPIVTVNRTSQHFDSEPAWFWSIQVQHTCTSFRIVSNHITYELYKHCFHFFLPICFARIRFA